MTEKYYTPSKEDYCIGLEYEYYVINNNKTNEWVKNILTQHNFSPDDWFYVFNTNNRVKYLDETDLIELGWHIDEKGAAFSIEGGFWMIRIREEGAVDLDYIDNLDWEAGFSIYKCQIKNKTEMKKLMEMLNIKTPKPN